ncbi:cupin domain-containing protein [Nocardia takedensis]
MHLVDFSQVVLEPMRGTRTETLRSRSRYVTHWMAGARGSASTYFELDPGAEFGRHYHSAEETIVVLAGRVEIEIGDERAELDGPGLAVAPALIRHNIRNIGDTVCRCVGFWPSASVVSIFDEPLEPRNSRRAGTPIPGV